MWGNKQNWTNQSHSLFKNKFVYAHSDKSWIGIHQNIYVNAGEYYTFSGWFNTNADRILILSYHNDDESHCETDVSFFRPEYNEDTWTYFAYTFQVTKSGNSKFRLEFDNAGNESKSSYCYIAALKLERGQKATPWSPSVNDILNWKLMGNRTNLLNIYDCVDDSNEQISFKYPGDGTIIIDGVKSDKIVTAGTHIILKEFDIHNFAGKQLKFGGADLSKMSASTCYICFRMYTEDKTDLQNECNTTTNNYYIVPENAFYTRMIFYAMSDCVVDNIVVKPYISTNLLMTYDTFIPYTGPTGYIDSDISEIQKILNKSES